MYFLEITLEDYSGPGEYVFWGNINSTNQTCQTSPHCERKDMNLLNCETTNILVRYFSFEAK